jgi:hypothetical protein
VFTQRERDRLKSLQKRANWLEARCAIAASRGQRLDFDEGELSALKWALDQLRRWELVRPQPIQKPTTDQ